MSYPQDLQVRMVKSQGDISWKNRHIYLSQTLAGELVGLRQLTEQKWDIFFGNIRLAQLNTVALRLIHLKRTEPKKKKKRQTTKD